MRRRALAALVPAALLVVALPAHALVGGQPTTRNVPHMVAMEFTSDNGQRWSFRCGGSLVARDVVLTAAHCVSGNENEGEPDTFPAGDFRFLAGTKKRSQGGERIPAVEVREHPDYDASPEGGFDVALLKLRSPTTLGAPIRLARADEAQFYAPGREAIVTGWGANAFQVGETSDDLEEITVPIRTDAECAASSVYGYDPDTMLCAGNTQGGEDSCQGDSGGPLMVTGADGGLVLVGAVSFGLGCAFPTQYGIYSELVAPGLRSWIDSNAAAMSAAGGPATATSITPGTAGPGGGGSTGDGGGAATGGDATPSARAPGRVRITLPARLRGQHPAVLVRSSGRVRSVRLTLRAHGRTVASGRATSISGRRRIRLRVRGRLHRETATLRVTARDAAGRTVRASRRVRLVP